MKTWYLLYCKRGQLARAQCHLEQQQVECFSPMLELEKVVRGKRRVTLEPLFPNYLFIEFDPEEIHTTTISATRGVSHFIRFGQLPVQIPSNVIKELVDQPLISQIHPDTPQPGDHVRILDGIFEGLTAIYTEPNGETRSMLLLNMLNQQVQQSIENTKFEKL